MFTDPSGDPASRRMAEAARSLDQRIDTQTAAMDTGRAGSVWTSEVIGHGLIAGGQQARIYRDETNDTPLTTPAQILDQHLAGLRFSLSCAQRDVDHMQEQIDRALAVRDTAAKAVRDFEAELAKHK